MGDSQHLPERADSESSTGSSCKDVARATPASGSSWLAALRRSIWETVCWALDEFEPWLKWMVYDAVFALVTAALVKRCNRLAAVFEALGWQ
mmetsp:Transcript_11443/g.29330  ORF Transcript_11443/g.29330 Transcript_11443/m.29330 type:complete len:92 (-) Transcript_11443:349-624(-)